MDVGGSEEPTVSSGTGTVALAVYTGCLSSEMGGDVPPPLVVSFAVLSLG